MQPESIEPVTEPTDFVAAGAPSAALDTRILFVASAAGHLEAELEALSTVVVERVSPPLTQDLIGAFSPDIVLLALESPASTRASLAALTRTQDRLFTAPVVAVATTELSDEQVCALLADGVTSVLRLPLATSVVHSRLAALARLKRRLDHAFELSMRDELTGLYNRRFLLERLDQEIARAARTREPLGLLLIDLDAFKPINDVLGHQAGDRLLARIAQELLGRTRRSDVLARLGGDELALLLVGNTPHGTLICAEKLREHLAELDLGLPAGLDHVTASFGIALLPVDVGEPNRDALIHAADRALLRAKALGGNCVELDAGSLQATEADPPALKPEH